MTDPFTILEKKDSEFELVKMFLQYDPFLYKSKYITKFFKTYDKYRK